MQSDTKAGNGMRDIRVAKLVLNICVGESGDRLQKAAKASFEALIEQSVAGEHFRDCEGLDSYRFSDITEHVWACTGAGAADWPAASLWQSQVHSAYLWHPQKREDLVLCHSARGEGHAAHSKLP